AQGSPRPAASRTTASSAAGSAASRIRLQLEAAAADGVYERTLTPPLELARQVADVHVDDVGGALEVGVPDVLDQVRPRDDVAGVAREVLEQREFARRELDRLAGAVHGVRGRVDDEVAHVQPGRTRGGAA